MKFYYNKHLAERAERFFEKKLVYPDGSKAGKPFLLEMYQKKFLRDSLGWHESKNSFPDDNKDLEAWNTCEANIKHQSNFLGIAKGNGKTPLLAGLAIFFCGYCGAKNASIYMIATTRDQARNMLDDCKNMIRLGVGLERLFTINKNEIIHKATNTKIKAVSKEAPSSEGLRPFKIIVDEYQEQPNADLINYYKQGIFKIKNAQIFYIGTAGRFNSYGEELYKQAKKIRDKIVLNDNWNVHIYEAPQDLSDEDIFNEKYWKAANPGLGTVKSWDGLRKLAEDAKSSISEFLAFKTRQLNIWANPLTSWMSMSVWEKCNKGPIDLEYHKRNKTVCFGGLDLGSRDDLTAAAFLFVEESNGALIRADLKLYFWCPNDTVIQKAKDESVNYPLWVRDNLIFVTPGGSMEKDTVFEFIEDFCLKYNVKVVNSDPSFHEVYLASRVEKTNTPYEGHSQGIRAISEPTKEFMDLITEGIINHEGNAVLRWQSSNGELWSDTNDNIKLMKATGRGAGAGKKRNKIDGLIASVLAVSGYLASKSSETKEIPEDYKIRIF